MKQETKEDIGYAILSGLIISMFLVLGAVYLTAFNHMSDKDKEDVIIIQMMNQP